MKLIITIDTEEDNWGSYAAVGHSVENIKRVPALQELFTAYGIKPTYLLSYPVVTDPFAVTMFQGFLESECCEIGSHCHPWNTPPYASDSTAKASFLCNLEPDVQLEKISFLHSVFYDSFGMYPVSFRAGRWGYGAGVAHALDRLGYKVDSSISAFQDWSDYYGPDFSLKDPKSYRFSPPDIFTNSHAGRLVEVPASTGFLQGNFSFYSAVDSFLRKSLLCRRLRVVGVLAKSRLMNKVFLCPETTSCSDMIALTKIMLKKNYQIVNFMFHSPSLQAGLTPYVKTIQSEYEFIQKIEQYIKFAVGSGIESITLSHAYEMF